MTTLQELDEVLDAVKQAKLIKDFDIQREFVSLNRIRALHFVSTHAEEIRAALELQAKLEQGFMLVPKEPTPEMLRRGVRMFGRPEFNAESISTVYRHMLNAATPTQGEPHETE